MENGYKHKPYNDGRDHAGQKENNPEVTPQLQFRIDRQSQKQPIQIFSDDNRYGIDKGIAYRQPEFAVFKYRDIILDPHKAYAVFSYRPVCKGIINPIDTGGDKKNPEYEKRRENQPIAVQMTVSPQ